MAHDCKCQPLCSKPAHPLMREHILIPLSTFEQHVRNCRLLHPHSPPPALYVPVCPGSDLRMLVCIVSSSLAVCCCTDSSRRSMFSILNTLMTPLLLPHRTMGDVSENSTQDAFPPGRTWRATGFIDEMERSQICGTQRPKRSWSTAPQGVDAHSESEFQPQLQCSRRFTQKMVIPTSSDTWKDVHHFIARFGKSSDCGF